MSGENMKTKIIANNDQAVIVLPRESMQILGVEVGDEVEFSKEADAVVLRSSSEAERKRKFEKAKREIFEEWNDVFVELAKGADDKTIDNSERKSSGKFILNKSQNGKYTFILIGANGKIILESSAFDSKEEARKVIISLKTEVLEIKDETLTILS
jgi:uncharacterized protein YegP (UPF0339 family)/antitoxin component of MazEF toxin-antitoxin module